MTPASPRILLAALVFAGGATTMAAEMAASRLLAPFFGTSTIVWAALIGLILIYLSVGNWVGGRWADRSPRLETLLLILAAAALCLAIVPLVSAPVLRLSVEGFAAFNAGLLGGSFVGVLLLFTVPMTLLGCVSPFAIRLAMGDIARAGRTAGQLYALSTLGSVLGTFAAVLWLIPAVGTRWTFWLIALTLLGLIALGALRSARRALPWALGALALVALIAALGSRQPIKPGAGLLYETESLYHYIRVFEQDGWTQLELNEGQGIHSVYRKGVGTSGGVWDYYLLAPLFRPAPYDPFSERKSWAIIGVAAGTTPRSIQTVYGDEPVHGVEIDGAVVEVGRAFFAQGELPNLTVAIEDGRTWLARDEGRYDVIGIDAYRQPYIPFHLATVEFFELARSRLTPQGAVAINVGRAPDDWRLVDALVSTMLEVFPTVYAVDVADSFNTLLIGTNVPVTAGDVVTNLEAVRDPALAELVRRAQGHIRVPLDQGIVFTDDRAPVEQVIDAMIARFALGEVGR